MQAPKHAATTDQTNDRNTPDYQPRHAGESGISDRPAWVELADPAQRSWAAIGLNALNQDGTSR